VPEAEQAMKAVTSLTLSLPLDSSAQQAKLRGGQGEREGQSEEGLYEGDDQREGGRSKGLVEGPGEEGPGGREAPDAGIDNLRHIRNKYFMRHHKNMSEGDICLVINLYGFQNGGKSMTTSHLQLGKAPLHSGPDMGGRMREGRFYL